MLVFYNILYIFMYVLVLCFFKKTLSSNLYFFSYMSPWWSFFYFFYFIIKYTQIKSEVQVSKKLIKSRKPEKKIIEKPNCEKNWLKFWKNQPVRFRFYNPETEKIEPKRKKTSQTKKTKPNRKKLSQTGLNQFLF